MNTKKLFFGLMAIAFFAMTAVSTTITFDESSVEKTSIKKKSQIKF